MADSIFTKIIKGEIPCHKIYEDDRVIAFLDIDPLTDGHTLVVPKQQTDQLWDVNDELFQYLMKISRKVAHRQREILRPARVGMMVEGFAVPHVHIHVVPLNNGFETTVMEHIERKKNQKEPDHETLAKIAKKLVLI